MKFILILFVLIPFLSIAEEGKPPKKTCKESFSDSNTTESKKEEEKKKVDIAKNKSIPITEKIKVEVSEGEKEKIEKGILYIFRRTLIVPRPIDVSSYLGIQRKKVEAVLGGSEVTSEFWSNMQERHPLYFKKLKNNIARSFIASIKSSDIKWKNRTPDVKRLYEIYSYNRKDKHAISLPKSIQTEQYLNLVLGTQEPPSKKKLNGAVPVLFPKGMNEIVVLARQKTPSAFKNYIDTNQFSLESDRETAQMILKSKGAIISTVTAEIPTDRDFFEALLRYAKEREMPIILLPVNGQTDGIDPYLLSMPDRVRVVTHTIELSEYLRIWGIPIMPKNMNPFASLDTYLQGKRGQVQIVGSPQQRYLVVPTADNKYRTHALWAPGSISENLYPSDNPSSGRVSELAKNRHNYGFLVLEMTDKLSGTMAKGIPGTFHIRPVKYFNHIAEGGTSGFTDLNYFYGRDKKRKLSIDTMVVGDIHDHSADQGLIEIYEEVIRENKVQNLVLHDALDGNSHNHHEAKRLNLMLEKYKRGELNIKKEVEGLIQTVNGFLNKFPQLNIILVDSNHHYWLENLLEDPYSIADIPNREFLVELLFARTHFGIGIYEYLFNHYRKAFHEGLDYRFRYNKIIDNIYIADPSRVKVMESGEAFIVGPDYNSVYLHFHGHQGANGARGGMPSHAKSMDQSVTGHSHQPSILGGAVNVGTSTKTELDYNKGGSSSWQNGFALVNGETGAIQLIVHEPYMGKSWKQNSKNGFIPNYSQPAPKVSHTDNEKSPPGVKVIDQYNKHQLNKDKNLN